MIPLFLVFSFTLGLVFGLIFVFVVLAIIQRFSTKYSQRHKITYTSPPLVKYNVEFSSTWLNILFERTYFELTKSDNLTPIVRYFCEKVASNEKSIHRLSLVDFSVGHNSPKLNSICLKPDVNGDSIVISFDFSPELDVNVDIAMSIVKVITIPIMAGTAVFFQSIRGGISIVIPENDEKCRISFKEGLDMNIEVGARIHETYYNTDEFKFIWEKVKSLIKTCIKNVEIKFTLEMPEQKKKNELEKPQKSFNKKVVKTNVKLMKPIPYLFL